MDDFQESLSASSLMQVIEQYGDCIKMVKHQQQVIESLRAELEKDKEDKQASSSEE
jgi:hypothetical protein